MEIDTELLARVLAPIVSGLLLAWVKARLDGRTKLVSYLVHSSAISLNRVQPPATPGSSPPQPSAVGTASSAPPQQVTTVHSHTIVVANQGKKTAHNVRISHSAPHLPDFSTFPFIQYRVETNPQGYSDIVFPTLVPKEQVTISYLYFPPLTVNAILGNVKSDEGMAKILDVIPSTRPNKYVVFAIGALAFMGGALVTYWLARWLIAWAIT